MSRRCRIRGSKFSPTVKGAKTCELAEKSGTAEGGGAAPIGRCLRKLCTTDLECCQAQLDGEGKRLTLDS